MLYETESFRRSLRGIGHVVGPALNELRREATQPGQDFPIGLQSLRGTRGFCKRRLPTQRRLIALCRSWPAGGSEMPVVLLLDVLGRDSGDYKTLIGSGRERLLERYERCVQAETAGISAAASAALAQGTITPPPRPPERLLRWGQSWSRDDRHDAVAFESRRWRESLNSLRNVYLGTLCGAIANLEAERPDPLDSARVRTAVGAAESLHLWYTVVGALPESAGHSPRCLVLLDFVCSPSETEVLEGARRAEVNWTDLRAQLLKASAVVDSALREEALQDVWARFSRKAYPVYYTADPEFWEDHVSATAQGVGRDRQHLELVFSAEEFQVENSLLAAEKLPMLLEGRAGSGKTTLLLYYLSEVLAQSRSRSVEVEGTPLFLTQSQKLLDNARGTVGSLLRRNPDVTGAFSDEQLETVFQTFSRFCQDLLPPRGRLRFADRSRPGGFVDAATFRDLYLCRSESDAHCFRGRRPPDVGPELAWFILRTYIKGRVPDGEGPEGYLDPEAFSQDLVSGEKSVTDDIFQAVHDRVWLPWYRRLTVPCDENEGAPPRWDDQDLARAALSALGQSEPRWPFIVCDEAQDFTRLEMQVLIRSFPYRRYHLLPDARARLFHLPLVMAGDPSQTINPSGFRWESVKEALSSELQDSMLSWREIGIHHRELTYNYRNPAHIAHLANAVQLARAVLLGHRPEPQRLFDEGAALSVRSMQLGTDLSLETLLDFVGARIVPDTPDASFWTALGAERLASLQEPPRGFWTPAEVKGLEYDRVVVLGFGSYFVHDLLERCPDLATWRSPTGTPSFSPAGRLSLEFFLNRLYVAITRATEELVIVDTAEGFEQLWNALGVMTEKWVDLPGHDHWREAVAVRLTPGRGEDLKGSDPATLAEQFAEEAEDQRDPDRARDAEYYFRKAGQVQAAERQEAMALYYEGRGLEAAQCLLRYHHSLDLAFGWLWEFCGWRDLAASGLPVLRGPKWSRRIDIAALMERLGGEEGSASDVKRLLTLLEEEESGSGLGQGLGPDRRAWQDALSQLLEASLRLATDLRDEDLERLHSFLFHLQGIFNLSLLRLGEMAYLLRRHEQARHLWEQGGHTSHPRYHEVVARLSPYPLAMRHWEAAVRPEEALRLFKENGENLWSLESDDRRRVARLFRDCGRTDEALRYGFALVPDEAARMWCDLYPADGDEARASIDSLLSEAGRLMRTEPGARGRSARATTENSYHFALALHRRRRPAMAARVLAQVRDAQTLRRLVEDAFFREGRREATGSSPADAGRSPSLRSSRRDLGGEEKELLRILMEPVLREVISLATTAREQRKEKRLCRVLKVGLCLYWREERVGRGNWTLRLQDWLTAWWDDKSRPPFLDLTVKLLSGPEGWLRRFEGQEAWKTVTQRLNSFAQRLLELLREARKKGGRLDDRQLAGWVAAGAVVGEARFRLGAVEFWQELREWAAKDLPDADLSLLAEAMERAEEAKRRHDERARAAGAEEVAGGKRPGGGGGAEGDRRRSPSAERQRSLGRDGRQLVKLEAGERWSHEGTVIKVHRDGTWIRIASEEDELGLRLQLDSGSIDRDAGVLVKEIGRPRQSHWQRRFSVPGWEVIVDWNSSRRASEVAAGAYLLTVPHPAGENGHPPGSEPGGAKAGRSLN